MEKIVLIDGHSILNRAFYGVPDLSNAEGLHTNAIYGFLNIMFKILEEEQAEYLAVAFDVKAPTFRHQMFEAYKGTRKPMPEELREQVPVMKDVLQAMGIQTVEKDGLEADDILGTLAKRSERRGMEVALISGDRDLLQIATEHIRIRIPKTKGGKTEIEDYYAKDVLEKYQVTPLQFIDLKALMGDTADNIPGVPKVGEKTATDLIVTFGSLEEVYDRIEEVSKKSVRESLAANRDLADLSKALATICVDAEIEFDYEAARIGDFYTKEAYHLFQKLGFKNMLSRFEQVEEPARYKEGFCLLESREEAEELRARLPEHQEGQMLAVEILEDGRSEEDFLGICLAWEEDRIYFIPVNEANPQSYLRDFLRELEQYDRLITFDVKKKYRYFTGSSSTVDLMEDCPCFFDVLIAAYLLNPLKNDYDVVDVAAEYLGLMIPGRAARFGKKSFRVSMQEQKQEVTDYICSMVYAMLKAAPILMERLEDGGMRTLMEEIEMPLSRVLYEMEQEGIRVRPEELRAYGEALSGRLAELEQKIYQQADCVFNINSPKQLGEILFERMGLPGGKKTKTGYSTAADVLEKLAAEHPIVADILEYRAYAKLKSTYAEGLAAYIDEDSRIRSSFNQTITATGRISSTEPNLQNIPVKMELGRMIRKVFVPKDGFVFLDADYSQIELRVLAHMSGDEQLIEAYRMDEDIHRITASKVFHTPFEEVTDLQRRNAKAVNFGIVYGISSFGLSQDLSISRKEAAAYIEQYFATYPKVKSFLEKLVEDGKNAGFVTTMFGRRRPVPELFSSNFVQRAFGERVAMNSPIQGTAADIIKIAMIRVWKRLREEGLESRLILQVHDELLIETKESELEVVRVILEEEMKKAADLEVTLEIDMHTGHSWYEAK